MIRANIHILGGGVVEGFVVNFFRHRDLVVVEIQRDDGTIAAVEVTPFAFRECLSEKGFDLWWGEVRAN